MHFVNNFVLAIIFHLTRVASCEPTNFEKLGSEKPQNEISFAVILANGERSCFHQYVNAGSELQISYKVLTPSTAISDNAITLHVKDPKNKIVFAPNLQDRFEGSIEKTVEGVYDICFFNYVGRFLEKKTQIFIGILNPYVTEEKEVEGNETINQYSKMTDMVNDMRASIFHVGHFMHFARAVDQGELVYRQMQLQFINRLSIGLTLTVGAVAYLQTYFLKRMFRTKLTTPSHKPRA